MRARQPSITAENNAAVRAFESMRPAPERICFDPFARLFLSDDLINADDPMEALFQIMSRWNLAVPGVCDAILVRTRFIDEQLLAAVGKGLQQLVILGAGYDTRALRFDRLMAHIPVFELDHPATQQEKLRRLDTYGLSLPDLLRLIPCRFDKDDAAAKLLANGYKSGQKTFFIWEGVTYYLAPSAIDRTLAFISHNAPPGSAVVFDYFPPSVADGTCRLQEALVLRQALQQMGEEISFGIDPETIADFLSARGMALTQHVTSEDARNTYLQNVDRPTRVSEMFYFAHATVIRKNDVTI